LQEIPNLSALDTTAAKRRQTAAPGQKREGHGFSRAAQNSGRTRLQPL